MDKRLKKHGLNSAQFPFLMNLAGNPGITQDKLSRLLFLNPSNITRALVQLEKKGYVRKTSSEFDKRTRRLYPTDKALKIVDEIQNIEHDWCDILSEHFTPEELDQFQDYIKRIALTASDYFKRTKEETKRISKKNVLVQEA
jgi:DNA-binding MarR family transcriptional regulator